MRLSGFWLVVGAMVFWSLVPNRAVAADKPVVGIAEIVLSTSARQGDVVSFRTMLETAIISSNKFSVMERGRLESILREQALGEAGVTNRGKKIGGLSGIDYLIYGTITQLGAKAQGSSFAGISTGSSNATMAVDLRITDVDTGEIRYAGTVSDTVSTGSSFNIAGISRSNDSDSSSDLGELQRSVAQKIAATLITSVYPIKIVSVQADGTVLLNYGDSLLVAGRHLIISSLGEAVKDPDSGEILGHQETRIGMLKVTEATPRFSKAVIVEGDVSKMAVGSIARFAPSPDTEEGKQRKRSKLP